MLETITPSASPSCCWAPSSPTNYPRCRRWIPISFSSNMCSTHKTFFAVLWVLFLSTVFYWQFGAASGGFSIFRRAFPSREFPILRRVAFNLTDFGGVGDGVTLNTEAFERAVTAISKLRGKGGGQLNVPPGIWLTAPFNLTSHMTLFLAEGAVILGIDDEKYWPLMPPLPSYGYGREHAGPRYGSLIHGQNLKDIVITGHNGTINGQGQMWWKKYRQKLLNHTRGPIVQIMWSSNILISNITLQDSPFWTLHPYDCKNVTIKNLTILAPMLEAPNTDGIDPVLNVKERDMGSLKIVDSGNLAGGRSNFSNTCSLLSRYLKEKGSFGDLTLGLAQKLESSGASAAAATGMMNLFPIMENSGETLVPGGEEEAQIKSDLSGAKSGAEAAQMTIFYGGQVLVFDDFPADKVSEIMLLANKPSGTQNHHHPTSFAAQSPSESATCIPNLLPSFGLTERALHAPMPPLGCDLPIARRNSLARFLEKRKDRIKEKAPYQEIKPVRTATPPVVGESTPGLAAV